MFACMQVNSNGVLLFGSNFTHFQPQPFPFTSSPLIAVFWEDFDPRKGGSIYYRQTTQRDILDQITVVIATVSPELQFQPNLAFIATWDGVAAFDAELYGHTNTFQVFLATDGSYSFVGFIYRDIQWTGSGQVGLNAGDGRGYSTLMRTNDILSDRQGSNVMIPGFYVYRLDSGLWLVYIM